MSDAYSIEGTWTTKVFDKPTTNYVTLKHSRRASERQRDCSSNVDLKPFALLASLPFVGLGIADDLLRLRIPRQLATEPNRDVR